MDSLAMHTFGPQFTLDDMQELELLTDLLSVKNEQLSILFAVASYLESTSSGVAELRPVLRVRLEKSVASLRRRFN